MTTEWGPGDAAETAEAFETGALEGGTEYELIFGDHPHSTSDNNIYARFPSPMGADHARVIGFDGHRVHVGVELQTYNYLKSSGMSGDEVRKGAEYRISLNGALVYVGGGRDPLRLLLAIREKIAKLLDLPVHVWEGEKVLVGRKVFYRDAPAVITMWIPDQGCIVMEHAEQGPFPKPPWSDDERERTIKDDVLSPHIWWFRDG